MVVGGWLHLHSYLEICLCVMAGKRDYEPKVVLFFLNLQKLLKAFLGLSGAMPHAGQLFFIWNHMSPLKCLKTLFRYKIEINIHCYRLYSPVNQLLCPSILSRGAGVQPPELECKRVHNSSAFKKSNIQTSPCPRAYCSKVRWLNWTKPHNTFKVIYLEYCLDWQLRLGKIIYYVGPYLHT